VYFVVPRLTYALCQSGRVTASGKQSGSAAGQECLIITHETKRPWIACLVYVLPADAIQA
jgi:hypothetical protein